MVFYGHDCGIVLACVKLSAWARQQGITYRTAWRSFRGGDSAGARRADLHRDDRVKPASISSGKLSLYARALSSDEKNDLDVRWPVSSPLPTRGACRLVDGR
jgi:hypothetical protein